MHQVLRKVSSAVEAHHAAAIDATRVKIASAGDIVTARERVRAIATRSGFSLCDCALITTALSEIARNIVDYAGHGDITISTVRNGNKSGLQIVAIDHGPGIADIRQVMQDGFSTCDGMGIGLPGAKRLMDEFEIRSAISKGTIITMTKWHR